jgi:predicted lipid-binding transport protein (Tim44 family)
MLRNRNRGRYAAVGVHRLSLIPVAAVTFTALATASPALARGGGGSAGFGGGGGGHFGGGGGYYGGTGNVSGAAVGITIAVVVSIIFAIWAYQRVVTMRREHRVSKRERRVEPAAAVAAEDDAAFATDTVHKRAAQLFLEIQHAWDADDRARLQKLVGPELWQEWSRRLADFDRKGWHNMVKPIGQPKVKYVGLHNVGDDREDRVVVFIEARLRDYVVDSNGHRLKRKDSQSDISHVLEYWTLAKRRGGHENRWIVVSIEQHGEGAHELREDIVATAEYDEKAMRDQALVEGATAEAVPEGTSIAEVADLNFEGDARSAANDLSLADGRFAPDVLEIAARRAVAAWAEAVDGDRTALEAIADGQVVHELLHPGDPSGQTRLVIRGPAAEEIRITALDARADPPTMNVEVRLAGCRYIEDRDTTAVVSGSPSSRRDFTEHWTMGLTGDRDQPWRLVAVGTPVAKT